MLADGRAPGYEVIATLLEAMAARGWNRVEEHGQLIALERADLRHHHARAGRAARALGRAVADGGSQAVRDNDTHIDELLPLAAELGITFLGTGLRPFGTLDDVPWMPKGRYGVMREYLPTRGTLGARHDEAHRDGAGQLRLHPTRPTPWRSCASATGSSSLVTALFATSPLVDGKPTGFQSYRARAWLDTDHDRCGLLPFVFEPSARFRDYAEWALDVPMFFVYRDGDYRAGARLTFRRFLREGWQGEHATMSDWELHLSTLFPEVRLKRYVEVREADAVDARDGARAAGAVARPARRPERARGGVGAGRPTGPFDERLRVYRDDAAARACRHAPDGQPMRELCRELVAIARAGLERSAPTTSVQLLGAARADRRDRPHRRRRDRAEFAAHGGDSAR